MIVALHSTAHAHTHTDIVPDIYTLTCTFTLLKVQIIEGSDNRGWTVLHLYVADDLHLLILGQF